jgi:hypothetical protein
MSLIAYSSNAYVEEDPHGTGKWSENFRSLMSTIRPTSHEITMLLALLSASVRSGAPLPPYVPKPAPFQLSERLESLDHDILSVRHINEPGYAAFAVLQLSSRCIGMDVDILVDTVRELVGELDFSFSLVNTENSSTTALGEGEKEKPE